MNSRRNVILIGMPGVGKSTIGVLLAKRLRFSFLDTDIFLQTQERKTLQEIIAVQGAEGFCDIEEKYVLSILAKAHVIATGGSVVYRHQAMKHLKKDGIVIHLDLELPKLKARLDDINARGVVITPGQSIDGLYSERRPLYLKYADIDVETGGLNPDQIVGKIVELLNPNVRVKTDGSTS
jgi:shikimate kinase